MKKLRITIEGKVYEVLVEILNETAPAARPVSAPIVTASVVAPPAPPQQRKPSAATGSGAVVSPLSGKVVAVAVTVGQEVKEGDQIITLEAMKMNTYITAPKAGKVQSISTEVGAGVEEGQILAEIA
jgi:biotin carboxyl carrier protein